MTRARSRNAGPPALVLGSGLTTLGTIRCLGRAGILAYCASEELGVVAASRWCRRIPQRLTPGESLASYLARLPLERAVLVPCTDAFAVAVASLEGEVTRRFPSSGPPRAAAETLVNKDKLGAILDRLNLPHPRTTVLRSEQDLDAVTDAELVGGFLKPCDSKAFFARYGVKAFSIASRADASARMRQVAEDGLQVMVQEFVPGPPTSHYFIDGFIDRTGRVCARFARQRLRMHPPRYGNSSAMISVPLQQVEPARVDLERLLAALEYRGIFSAEFVYDERDRTFKLIEVNARPWWYVEFAARCGVDVCAMAYRDALDQDIDPVDGYRTGVTCVNTRPDLVASLGMIRRGELKPGKALGGWLRAEKAIFHVDDPLPSVSDFVRSVDKWFRGLWRARDGA